MTEEQKKEAELEILEQNFDTFPLSKEEADQSLEGKWIKLVPELSESLRFSTEPDFLQSDIFFEVMNGSLPAVNKNIQRR